MALGIIAVTQPTQAQRHVPDFDHFIKLLLSCFSVHSFNGSVSVEAGGLFNTTATFEISEHYDQVQRVRSVMLFGYGKLDSPEAVMQPWPIPNTNFRFSPSSISIKRDTDRSHSIGDRMFNVIHVGPPRYELSGTFLYSP